MQFARGIRQHFEHIVLFLGGVRFGGVEGRILLPALEPFRFYGLGVISLVTWTSGVGVSHGVGGFLVDRHRSSRCLEGKHLFYTAKVRGRRIEQWIAVRMESILEAFVKLCSSWLEALADDIRKRSDRRNRNPNFVPVLERERVWRHDPSTRQQKAALGKTTGAVKIFRQFLRRPLQLFERGSAGKRHGPIAFNF